MKPSFKVLLWDINLHCVHYYDVMEYFLDEWEEDSQKTKRQLYNLRRRKKRDYDAEAKCHMPRTYQEVQKWILSEAQYQFWGRCEYEVIVQDWPCQKYEEKIDAYDQIKANIDAITQLFIDYVKPL